MCCLTLEPSLLESSTAIRCCCCAACFTTFSELLCPCSKFWQWQLGWLLFITGNIINFVSFGEQRAVLAAMPAAVLPECSQGCPAAGYAAQSLLAAIGSVQFVSNLVFAATVLKDTIPPRIVFATALIVAGDLLLVVFGSKESPEFTAWELAALYRAPGMVLYMSLAFGFGGFTHLAAPPSGHHDDAMCTMAAEHHAG